MGKGTINSHLGSGKYNITVKIDRTRAEAIIVQLTAKITEYDSNILPAISAEVNNNYVKMNGGLGHLNDAISKFKAGTIDLEGLRKWIEYSNVRTRMYHVSERKYNRALLERAAIASRKQYILNNIGSDITIDAWCADLTETLSGDVGIMEIPNERTHDVIIRPGYGGGATYSASRDGQSVAIASQSPAQTFYNYAMFPGWQRWKPTYRIGTITWISGNLCDVTLDAAVSSVGAMNVNAQASYTNVPIVYMDCNGDVFQVNDRVVVEFISQDYTDPRVIGFETNPKECGLDLFIHRYGPLNDSRIQRQTGTTCVIRSQCEPYGILVIDIPLPWGLTFDWNNNKLIYHDWNGHRLHISQDVDTGDYCNVPTTILSFPWTDCLAFDGTDLWSIQDYGVGGITVRRHSGISSTIAWSKNLSNLSCDSFTYIGSGKFALGLQDWGRSPYACIKVYDNTFSSVLQEFTWPPGAVDGPTWNSAGPDGLTILPNGDLVSYGGRKQETPPHYDYLTVHNGVSATIKSQCSLSVAMKDGLVYPDQPPTP